MHFLLTGEKWVRRQKIIKFEAKLRVALLASLRSAIFIAPRRKMGLKGYREEMQVGMHFKKACLARFNLQIVDSRD
jgi:hypothetical protein